MNTNEIRNSLDELLGPVGEPVAVTFLDETPAGIERVSAAAPAGCSLRSTVKLATISKRPSRG